MKNTEGGVDVPARDDADRVTTRSTTRLAYLPALDGLRAVAVTLVVAYHLDVGWARGGFLGVDLFFVISGFLITTLLLQERDSDGRISLRAFWARRFRRLVPPLAVMTAVTVLATRIYGIPEQWNAIRWDNAAALGYVANWRFTFAGQSYFETLLGPSPLRHTWSLAVEEQWYLAWPLVVVGLLVLANRRQSLARLPLVLIGLGIAGSTVLMAALYDASDPSRVYFGTDTRAQQLLVGAGLAWVLARRQPTVSATERTWARPLVLLCATGFLVAAMTVPDEARWLYHGGFLAMSLVAAVLVWAVSTPATTGPLAWLGSPALVWVGRRSYGIYLWHWPVIVFVGEPMGIDLARLPLAVLQVGVTLILAELSFRLVEHPARTSAWRPSVVIGSWTSVSAATVLVAAIVLVPPKDQLLLTTEVITPSAAAALPEAASTPTVVSDDDTADADPGGSTPPTTPAVKRTALLLGDSTALTVLIEYDRSVPRAWSFEGFAALGCSTTPGEPVDVGQDYSEVQEEHCLSWRQDWAHWLQTVDPGVAVVMIGAWEVLDHRLEDGVHRFPNDDWVAIVRAAISEALDIAGSGGRPVVALALPCMRWNIAEPFNAEARNDQQRVDTFNSLLEEIAATKPDARVLDLPGLMCPNGQFLEEIDGQPVRYDGVHVTQAGANLFIDWLNAELEKEFPADGTPSAPPSPAAFLLSQ